MSDTVPTIPLPPELQGRLTLTVPEAAHYYGLGRSAAYEAAARGEIPSLRFAGRVVIPVARMLEQLGVLDPGQGVGA